MHSCVLLAAISLVGHDDCELLAGMGLLNVTHDGQARYCIVCVARRQNELTTARQLLYCIVCSFALSESVIRHSTDVHQCGAPCLAIAPHPRPRVLPDAAGHLDSLLLLDDRH